MIINSMRFDSIHLYSLTHNRTLPSPFSPTQLRLCLFFNPAESTAHTPMHIFIFRIFHNRTIFEQNTAVFSAIISASQHFPSSSPFIERVSSPLMYNAWPARLLPGTHVSRSSLTDGGWQVDFFYVYSVHMYFYFAREH